MQISICYPLDMARHILTQGFGENPETYKRFTVKGLPLQGHNGLDFAPWPVGQDRPYNSQPQEVWTAAEGEIIRIAYEKGGFGNYVIFQHDGFRTLYAHLSVCQPSLGRVLQQGTTFAYTGSTGFSTGIHLHFGLYPDGEPLLNGFGGAVDPTPYFGEGGEFLPSGEHKVIHQPNSNIPYKVFYLKPKRKGHR